MFLHMPSPRSILAICNQEREKNGRKRSSQVPESWANKVTAFAWRVRADAYDDHQRERAEHEREEDRLRRRQQQIDAEEEQRQREIEDARLLREKAAAVLSLPHVQQRRTRKEGQTVEQIEIKPARAPEFYAATRMFESSHKLARQGLEMVQGRSELRVTWKEEAKQLGVDPDDLVNAYLQRLRDQAQAGARSSNGGGISPLANGTNHSDIS